ncbi:hypothetical protein ACOSP7_011164 [Xanthoceras sorbifolium]
MMIKKGISVKKCNKKKQVLYGILFGSSNGTEFLGWEIVKFAKLGHHLVSVSLSSSSASGMTLIKDPTSKKLLAIKKVHSRFCRGFSTVKKFQLPLKGSISQGGLINKVLKRLAKHCADMAVVVGTDQENTLGSLISCARCCVDWLPGRIAILVPTRSSILQLRGFRLNSRPQYYRDSGYAEEVVVGNISESEAILISEVAWKDGDDLKDELLEEKVSLTSISLIRKELPESAHGWPLLQRTISLSDGVVSSRRPRTRNKSSVVEWVMMSLPSRNTSVDWNETNTASPDREIDNNSCVLEDHHNIEENIQGRIQAAEDESTTDDSLQNLEGEKNSSLLVSGKKMEVVSSSSLPSLTRKLSQSKLGWPLLRITVPESSRESGDSESSMDLQSMPQLVNNCKQFSYAELERATCQFSSENLIGEGGCSNVYKGCLSSGKPVAVKVLKFYKEAWSDFCLEVDITYSLKHKHITPLVGVCMEDNYLVLVYDFMPKGSLDELLHGEGMKYVLPWEVRFNVAVAIAEALNYLHNECLRPVIHRDVKSSNILLSNELEPQLSDFGLAIWGPTDSTYMIHEDVAGTFGYIAPEYFMRATLSDKIDVYSYGVVLLELISGRKPISAKNLEGQESLVQWAKPLLKTGDVEALLDPNLVDVYDRVQMQRMVLVANLCINQPPQHRPKANQMLRLLRREDDGEEWVESQAYDVMGSDNQQQEEEDLLELSCCNPRLDFSFLHTHAVAVSISSVDTAISLASTGTEQKPRLKLKDYLQQQQD